MPTIAQIAAGVALGIVLGPVLLALCTGGVTAFKRDATDSDSKRSGLMVYTDHGTGVQYVVGPLGGVAVRVDAEGKPMKAGQ